MRRSPRLSFFSIALLLLVGTLMLPVLSVALSWLQFDGIASAILREMAQTVLPDYAFTSLVLCVSVAIGVALVGMATASAITLFNFPGRRVFEWALLLPLAMPAYVLCVYRLFAICRTPANRAAEHVWPARPLAA
jgi:iron(III) transport system permease protein